MAFKEINLNSKPLSLHKAHINPEFNSKTILVTDTWDYVEMWLKRGSESKKKEALFFWQQARHFYNATKQLPNTSSPLTAYYCFLNSTKALLLVKSVNFSDQHGVSGYTKGSRRFLTNEIVKFHASGVLPALINYLGENQLVQQFTLKDLLYNLPYIHRAYDLTFKSSKELFIPVKSPVYVKKSDSYEAWFCAKLDKRYTNQHTINKLPDCFELDNGKPEEFIIRSKKRFDWKNGQQNNNLRRLSNYHQKIRKNLFYIYGAKMLWYIKRKNGINGYIEHTNISLIFAAMHRLSELARYSPNVLASHFDSNYNWLLSEFISNSLTQFIDEISSEITGHEFMIPGIK
ncbi:MAG: YaaC family protein [Gloeocapsa sp. UFS-A4-WI-NPMV-4B04]|jgi:uncharacterized protein (UPF0332 family)|nr:YaaC family protein [Gloeocapsa sp. UFS-A4-WI-NPMV-4B04]